jgi:Starch-binding associating with outer membrane
MKNIIKYTIVLATTAILSSCDNITDLNSNPSFPDEVQTIALMPSIEQQMAQGIQFDTRFLGRYTQYFSNVTTGNEWDRYGYVPASDAGGEIWRMTYFGIGLNLSKVAEKAQDEKRYDILGFSKVVRAWSWQVTTDYSSELIDFDQVFTSRLTFDYVPQQESYAEVVRLLEAGIVDLARTDGLVSQGYFRRGDAIYGGDPTKWTKFAYGVLARNMNNQINKASYNADKVIEYCDKSLASNADDALVKFNGSVADDANFFGPTRNNFNAFRQTDFAVRTMNGSIFTGAIDPRLSRVLVPSRGTSETLPATAANPNTALYVFNGNPLNTTATTAATNNNAIPNFWGTYLTGASTNTGRYLFRDKADFPLMTYAEIQFIKAEAAFKKGDKVLALDAYTKGITASIDVVNRHTVTSSVFPVTTLITAAEKATFLANVNVVPTNANALTLSQIMMQKYVALYGFGGLETWTDMRKYRYDPLVYQTLNTVPPLTGLFPDNAGKLPYRVRPRYNSEYVWNFAALVKIGGDLPDYHTQEMWFMQN